MVENHASQGCERRKVGGGSVTAEPTEDWLYARSSKRRGSCCYWEPASQTQTSAPFSSSFWSTDQAPSQKPYATCEHSHEPKIRR